jgi:hypothetical protein
VNTQPTTQPLPQPVTLGLKKSFGYGDRLGLATPGHLAAHRKFDFAPIFAQQSIREMDRTQRTAEEVMSAAKTALAAENFHEPWGADADHLKTEADVYRTAAVGYTFFTIDPSTFVVNEADRMERLDIDTQMVGLVKDGVFPDYLWPKWYLEKDFPISGGVLRFDRLSLFRAAIKYSRAIAHCEKMGGYIKQACGNRPFEIEVSVDETDSPTSIVEHLFFALELKRRKVPNIVSLAPRFIGEFEKGIDFKGDLKAFEKSLVQHVEVAKAYGPYKISVHSGSDKFSVYPIIGRVCGELVHVKTAGTSYLEALRAVCRKDKKLFRRDRRLLRGPLRHRSCELPHLDDARTNRDPRQSSGERIRKTLPRRNPRPPTPPRHLRQRADSGQTPEWSNVQRSDPRHLA